MTDSPKKDLVILVADKNMEFSVRGILSRVAAMKVREIAFDLYVHPEKDPGCLNRGSDFLRIFSKSHAHALILFDHAGCGRETSSSHELESGIESQLVRSGWNSAAAIVIAPELENWVWSDSPHVDAVLGWTGKNPALKSWLIENGHWVAGEPKPGAPKEALEAAIKVSRKQRSSSLYFELATRVSLDRCSDRAFIKLKETVRSWFGAEQEAAN